ncbi:MAG: GTPase HflX [Acidobacteriota bacterium]
MQRDPRSLEPIDERAVLVAVQLPGVSDEDLVSSLDELERLASTLGLRTVSRMTQRRATEGSPTLVGAGKLREIARWTGGSGSVPSSAGQRADTDDEEVELDESSGESESESPPVPEDERATIVVVDHELSPTQLRNLTGALGAEIMDRPSVILSIFQRHARTREAKLQVELARLEYLAPRLRATGSRPDRQRGAAGGIGGRGAGESSLELDRRKVRDRIAALKDELVIVRREAATRRSRRTQRDLVALVGYTNAGKSSLMRALTGSEILVADQLFATLDTTVRKLHPETRPRILVSDTVGFIDKLPHDLVASFRSTLEEAGDAALLLIVVDASDPAWRSQLAVTRKVLGEIDADDGPIQLVLNKMDRLSEEERVALADEHPDAILLSAHRPEDVTMLHERIVAHFEEDMVEEELLVPHADGRMVNTIHESCRVLSISHEDEGTRLRVRAPPELVSQLRGQLGAATETAAGS